LSYPIRIGDFFYFCVFTYPYCIVSSTHIHIHATLGITCRTTYVGWCRVRYYREWKICAYHLYKQWKI